MGNQGVQQLVEENLYVGLSPLGKNGRKSISATYFYIYPQQINSDSTIRIYYKQDQGLIAEIMPS